MEKNHSIDNIYINSTQDAGLFGRASNVVISNLKISGSVFGKSSAGIIGQGSGNITCINLRNECNVQGTGSGNTGRGVGGIVGYIVNSGNGPKIKFVNCENKGSIVGEQSAGGIIGYVYAPGNGLQNVYIYNSYNHGNVQSGTGNAGGIIGWLNADEGKSNGEIYNCYNTGKISSTTQESQSGGCTGGIYGLFRSMTSATLEIKNSYILEELSIRVGKSGWQCLVNEEKLTIDNKNADF